MQPKRTPTRKKAFTLIELLVVISIIALLVAILMPALNKAKQLATGSVCLNNQRGLSTAWIMYAGDNDDKIVGAAPGTNGFVLAPGQTLDEAGIRIWSNDLESQRRAKMEACKQGLLWKYIEAIGIYHCPGDKRDQRKATSGNKQHAFRSYSLPHGLNGGNWGIMKDYKDITAIKSPADQICFAEESDDRGFNDNHWTQTALDFDNWGDPVAIWHGDSSTFSFCDGHAEMKKWDDPITIQNSEEDRTWGNMLPSPGSPDIAWINRHYPYANK